MSNPCLFNLENYDCDLTKSQHCIEVLEKKFHSNLTPARHKEFIPGCAKNIEKKGPKQFGRKAMGIYSMYMDRKEGKPPEEKSLPFHEHLTNLDVKIWESFIREKAHEINPFRLVLFLKERWTEKKLHLKNLNEPEEQELLQTVDDIMRLILEAFSRKRTKLHDSMKMIKNEIRDRQREHREKQLKEEIEELRQEKKWYPLAQFLENKIDLHEYVGDFITYVEQVKKEAGEGKKWLEAKEELKNFIAHLKTKKLDRIFAELSTLEKNISFLFTYINKYSRPEEEIEIENFVKTAYQTVLLVIRKIEDPEDRYKEVNLREKELGHLFPPPPAEWYQYKEQLEQELSQFFTQLLEETLETKEDLEAVRQEVDAIERRVLNLGIDGMGAEIRSAKTQLAQLAEFANALEVFLAKEDPLDIPFLKVRLNELESGYQEMEKSISWWAVCRHLKEKFVGGGRIIAQTAEIVDEIDNLVGEVGKESRKILYNDLTVNIGQFSEKLRVVQKNVTNLLEANNGITFLENLKSFVIDIKYILFPPAGEDSYCPEPHPFSQPIRELINSGQNLRNTFETLILEKIGDPVELIDRFLQVIKENKDLEFLLVAGEDKKMINTIEKIKTQIDKSIEAVLKPIREKLIPFVPLVSIDELEDFETQLTNIRTRIPGSSDADNYNGYEEISLPFEQKLDEMMDMVLLQHKLHEKQYEDSKTYIRQNNYSSPAFKNHMNACIYYYENLDGKEWKDNQWLDFFRKYGFQVADSNGGKNDNGILEIYQTLFEKNLFQIDINLLKLHSEIFKQHFPSGYLSPYLNYIGGESEPKQLLGKIKNKKLAKKVFPMFLQYMERNLMWTKYVNLYNACDDQLKANFSQPPFDVVHRSLTERYEKLKKDFIPSGSITLEELDAFYNLIPGDEEFRLHLERYEELESLLNHLSAITTALEKYQQEDIWRNDYFKASLGELETRCNNFSGDFAPIRVNNKWERTINHLRNVYDLGLKIIDTFKVGKEEENPGGIDLLENYKSKATVDYSNKLQQFLTRAIDLRVRFRNEIEKLPTQFEQLPSVFNHYHYRQFIENWRKLELCSLCQKQGLKEPPGMEAFFDMLAHVLENHQSFLKHTGDGKKKVKPSVLNEKGIKVLDPFIHARLKKDEIENH